VAEAREAIRMMVRSYSGAGRAGLVVAGRCASSAALACASARTSSIRIGQHSACCGTGARTNAANYGSAIGRRIGLIRSTRDGMSMVGRRGEDPGDVVEVAVGASDLSQRFESRPVLCVLLEAAQIGG